MRKQVIHSVCITIMAVTAAFAQEKEKDSVINNIEEVIIVKAYSPSVSDAFKVKSNPSLDDSVTTTKRKIEYTIFSVPVASTFTPAKGKASTIEKTPRERLYNTYASLGVGNYTTVLADFFTSRALSRNETLDIGLRHHSSQGGIKDVVLDDKFFNTNLDASYYKRGRDLSWGADFGADYLIYNWYGVPEEAFSEAIFDGIDEQQSYLNVELGAHVDVDDSYFNGGEILLRRFSVGFSSAEYRARLSPSFEFYVSDQLIKTNVFVDYLSGSFDKSFYEDTDGVKYGNVQFGLHPSVTFLFDDITLDAGATVAYMMDMENDESKFYVYPNITASYKLVDEFVNLYAGAEGKLTQNSYYDFVSDNQFVSPTLYIAPTSQQFDIYAGINGKLLANLSYDLKAGYNSTDDYAFFSLNPEVSSLGLAEGYHYGNSYGVLYDKLNAVHVTGELAMDISANFSVGLNATYNAYSTEMLEEPLNLPSIKGTLFSNFKIGQKWFGGVNIFYVGERKDYYSVVSGTLSTMDMVTMDAYFDANLNVGYKVTDKLSAFLKLNNIANNDYQRWYNYPVQGFQGVIGATYKFDF